MRSSLGCNENEDDNDNYAAEGHDVFSKTLIFAVFPELYAIVALAGVFLIGSAVA